MNRKGWNWERVPYPEIKLVGLPGYRRLYKLIFSCDDPIVKYVVADYCYIPGYGPETMVFECDEQGCVTDWDDLWVGYDEYVRNDYAIQEFVKELNEATKSLIFKKSLDNDLPRIMSSAIIWPFGKDEDSY